MPGHTVDVMLRVEDAGVETNLDARASLDHQPKSIKIAKVIRALDWVYGNDALDLKFGVDGDNGEHLLMLLDIAIEARLIE